MGVQPDDLQVARLLKPVHRILGFLYPVVMPPDCGCRQEHVHQGGVRSGVRTAPGRRRAASARLRRALGCALGRATGKRGSAGRDTPPRSVLTATRKAPMTVQSGFPI